MYEQIASNKRRSILLILFFIVLIFGLTWAFEEVTGFGKAGLVVAIIVAAISGLAGYYGSDKIVLTISRAKPATKEEYPYLYNVVEGLAIAAGVPTPKCYVIEDTALNAFASGRDPEHSVICVTTGLLQKLNRSELEGVVGHEMSHIRYYDIRLGTLAVVMVGVVALLSDWILRGFFWGGGRRRGGRDKGNAGAVLLVIGLVMAVLAPLASQLIQLAISRKREFLADAGSAELTRYPEGLASALKKIAADTEPLEAANKATAHLYIVNPLRNLQGRVNNLFSTHPPIEDRIKALEAM